MISMITKISPAQSGFQVTFIFLFSFVLVSMGPVLTTEAQIQPHLGSTSKLMEQAKGQMQAKEFEKANFYFRQIIESGVSHRNALSFCQNLI